MTRKKILFLLLLGGAALTATGQTQQGYVKTLGRPGHPGVPLPGVAIRVRGLFNQVLSGQDGRFSVPMTDRKEGDAFVLQQVRKPGYELRDRELTGRQQVFSPRVPIVIVMVNSEQLAADRQRIEQKAYQVAEHNYKSKLAQLDQQVKEQHISAEQYRQQLQDLQDKYEKYQSLIGDMADRYARTDYDQLDSIDRVINICIENGELDRADSLIHTVFDPSTVLERNRQAKAEVQARMAMAQQIIDKANADREAMRRDTEYALRVAQLSENLADEYVVQGDPVRALDCLSKSLDIKRLVYGEQSAEVQTIRRKISQLQPSE